jgi:phosphate:Na+ symporter
MFHTIFNVVNTLVFFPFVKPFASLVSFLIKDTAAADFRPLGPYRLEYSSGMIQDSPLLNIARAEKEVRDMAGVVSSMYARISGSLDLFRETENKEALVNDLVEELKEKEAYADEMREALTQFLIECTRRSPGQQAERNISHLLRIIADLEDMTDACYGISLLLERSVKKDMIFKGKEMDALSPYAGLVEEFLTFVREHLGHPLTSEHSLYARTLEDQIDKSRDHLRKLGRKRIEAGEKVKTELLFIDLVRRIEGVGDYCYSISEALSHMR